MKKIINNIIRVVAFIIHLIFIIYLIKLNVLPILYLSIIIGVIVIIDVISWILISKGKIKLIIGYVLLFIISIISCFGIYYTYTTDNFLSSLKEVEERQLYYVVVKKDSDYSKLKDLNNKSMAVFLFQQSRTLQTCF